MLERLPDWVFKVTWGFVIFLACLCGWLLSDLLSCLF